MSMSSNTLADASRHLLNARGRCDRRALLAVTVGLLAVQAAMAIVVGLVGGDHAATVLLALNLPLLWIGANAVLKRLHDIGWSGWWIGPAVLFWLVGSMVGLLALTLAVGPDRFSAALAAYPALHLVLVVTVALPPFGGLLWLQASEGQPTANRFGPAPGADGFAAGPREAAVAAGPREAAVAAGPRQAAVAALPRGAVSA